MRSKWILLNECRRGSRLREGEWRILGVFINKGGRLLVRGVGRARSDIAKATAWVSVSGRSNAWRQIGCEFENIRARVCRVALTIRLYTSGRYSELTLARFPIRNVVSGICVQNRRQCSTHVYLTCLVAFLSEEVYE